MTASHDPRKRLVRACSDIVLPPNISVFRWSLFGWTNIFVFILSKKLSTGFSVAF